MSRSHELYLRDILRAYQRILDFTDGLESEDFKGDELRIDGVLFNLMTIGEAIKNIPQEQQDKYPNVRWKDISRFRDRVVHHYFKLDLEIVWEIIQDHLPILAKQVEKMLNESDAGDQE